MTALETLKTKLAEVATKYTGKPVSETLAMTRTAAIRIVQDELTKLGLWENVKDENPGKFLVIASAPTDETQICVYLSDYLKDLLKGK